MTLRRGSRGVAAPTVGLFFREQMVRLTRQGIRVFITKGNHDAESVIDPEVALGVIVALVKREVVPPE